MSSDLFGWIDPERTYAQAPRSCSCLLRDPEIFPDAPADRLIARSNAGFPGFFFGCSTNSTPYALPNCRPFLPDLI